MLKIGITGGIGSGKSYICKIFEQLGVPVYNADEKARNISNNSISVKKDITNLFGKEAYENNVLNRAYIASKVFNDTNLLEQLNQIIHPAVNKDFNDWCNNYQDKSYILKEAAILFESGIYKNLDKTILVTAPESIRINRVIKRDGSTKEEVLNRMKNQWPTEKITPLADFIIHNIDKELLLPEILKIHNTLNN
jgi:dephospho-CoA kinase